MTKKILFLLTFLLTTLGGGNLAWAATETFDLLTVTSGSSYDQTQNGVRLVIDKGSSQSGFYNGRGYRLWHSGATITITAPEGYAVTELVLTSFTGAYGNHISDMAGFIVTGNSDWNPFSSGGKASYTWTNGSNTTNPITFTTKNSSTGDVYIASITVTYSKLPYSGTMPYTWNFHYGGGSNYWPYTTGDMLTSSSTYWQTGSVGSQSGYLTKTALNNEDLVDGSGNVISETKGLKFKAAAGNIGTALQYELALQGSASVTIPAKAGQKIAVSAYWPAETMNLTNATENTSSATTFRPSSADVYTYNFTATADNVTLQVNSSMVFIYSIAVTKNDITRFDFKDGGANPTTYNYDSNNPTFSPVLIIEPSGAASNNSLFTVTNSTNTEVIAIANSGCSSITNTDNINFANSLQRKKPGTSTVTFSFAGNDAYEPATFTATYTINKLTPTVTFDKGTDQKILAHSEGSYTNAATASNGKTVTYTSSNTNVATVSAGVVTFHNSGVTTITATAVGDDYYNEASASYKLTVTGSHNHVLTWDTERYTSPEDGVTERYGNTYWNRATCSTGTVKYSIDDPSIATISVEKDSHDGKQSLKIVPKSIGSTTVRAYVESSGDYNGAELTFTLTVNKGLLSFHFEPASGTVKKGLKIAPRLIWPSDIKLSDIVSISAVSNNTDVATIPADLNTVDYETRQINSDGTIIKRVFPVITASSSNTGDATITVTFASNLYETVSAEYTLTVVENTGESLGSWTSDVRQYTLYTDDFMKMPEVTSSGFSGNFNYSVGSINESSQNYLYDIRNGVITFNNKDWKRGEGVPDFIIENHANSTTGEAYIFWIKGGSDDEAELFIYAKQAGDVILKAQDSQTLEYLPSITIHIIEKSKYSTHTTNKAKDGATGAKYVKVGNVDPSVVTTWTNGKKFPFTWDFTNIESISDPTNCYWIKKDDTTYSLGFPTTFNYDYADIDNNNNTFTNNEVWYKPIHLTEMEGMTIWIGNNATGNWKDKNDKVRIYTKDSNDPCLYMNGGNFKLTIPNNPSEGQPDHYKVFVKVAGNGGNKPRVIINVNGTIKLDDERTGTVMNTQVVSADVNSGEPVILTFNNVKVYWIAFSTEARTLMRPDNTSYAAATYSYNEDLDLIKSNEANGVTAYYASSFTVEKKDVSAGSTNGAEPQYAVMMKPLTSLNDGKATYVTANKGILLKKNADVGNANCYMIANPRNVDSYSAPETITGDVKNYLVGTGASSAEIDGRGTDADGDYTNFLMGYAYKYYTDVTDPNSGSAYRFDRDWSFYPLIVSGTYNLAAQRCYLKIPGNLYVDRNGNLVVMPSSSRRSAGESAEAPATKAALSIVFDDDPLTGQGTTGISTVATETTIDSDAWYTLQGVRVDVPAKGGIYIHKGRKIVVK